LKFHDPVKCYLAGESGYLPTQFRFYHSYFFEASLYTTFLYRSGG
jgi:hypothetical protein